MRSDIRVQGAGQAPAGRRYEVSYTAYRHELGAPLATAIAGLELLRQHLADPSVSRDDLAFLVERCLHAAHTLAASLSIITAAQEDRAA